MVNGAGGDASEQAQEEGYEDAREAQGDEVMEDGGPKQDGEEVVEHADDFALRRGLLNGGLDGKAAHFARCLLCRYTRN